jgi:hypothetical protein
VQGQAAFSRSDFVYDVEANLYLCPCGKELKKYHHPFCKLRGGLIPSPAAKGFMEIGAPSRMRCSYAVLSSTHRRHQTQMTPRSPLASPDVRPVMAQGSRRAFDRFLGHSFRCRSEGERAVRVETGPTLVRQFVEEKGGQVIRVAAGEDRSMRARRLPRRG